MTDDETMGRNAYAKHQGVAPSAVTKAVRSGRIARAVVWDGQRIKAIKWRLADKLWSQNTDLTEALRTRQQLPPEIRAARPGAVQTSAQAPANSDRMQLEDRAAELAGTWFSGAVIPAAAGLVENLGLGPEQALKAVELTLIGVMAVADHVAGRELLYRIEGALEATDAQRPEIVAEIERAVREALADPHGA